MHEHMLTGRSMDDAGLIVVLRVMPRERDIRMESCRNVYSHAIYSITYKASMNG
jgi:hypothetical protein